MLTPRLTAALLAFAALHTARAQDCRFQEIGALGPAGADARALSDDGSTLVGVSATPQGAYHAFRWTRDLGIVDLDTRPAAPYSLAWAVSADGAVVVGRMNLANGQSRAFRWTAPTGLQDLGALGGDYSEARAVSDDGRTVIGYARNPARQMRWFRWTPETGMLDTGLAPAGYLTMLSDVAGDVVIGTRGESPETMRAFRYDPVNGPVDLGSLRGSYSSADAASADGQTIVGYTGGLPFAWTPQTGMNALPSFAGFGYASCITSDGRWVGGNCDVDNDQRTHMTRWDLATGAVLDLGAHSSNADPQVIGIGAAGRVLGVGITVNGIRRSYRWTPGADHNLDGFVDFFDLLGYTDDFEAGLPAADTNGDHFIDFFDYLDFVAAFESGC